MRFNSRPDCYDKMMRLPVILFNGFFLVRESGNLADFLAHYQARLSLPFIAELAARISIILFLVLLIGMHAVRAKPINKAKGWEPRLSA